MTECIDVIKALLRSKKVYDNGCESAADISAAFEITLTEAERIIELVDE